MPIPARGLLNWQFELTWAPAEVHLNALTEDDFLWRPAPVVWTVHRGEDGRWRPDWAEIEPDPMPAPTVAWLSWHIDWWWGTALAHLEGREPTPREQVCWPGTGAAALQRLRALRTAWAAALDASDDATLEAPSAYPWPAEAGLTVAHLADWVNAELLKNVAEIGQLRIVRAASLACQS
ncbi:DinB family protein [Nocardia farcinica]|uniref:DinB family protein n=1 Tax=Nocardia farcinica TaxID=37329 RepID=UPI002456E813|nr:DinB family protein [Nocardia farcinica]